MSSEREVSPDREICPVLELWKDDDVAPVVESPVLVGRLVADFKRFSAKVIGEALTRIWNLRQPVKVSEVTDNTFVFHFSSLTEKERALTGSPWSFGGHLLCLKEWLATVELQAIDFEHVELWVQVSGLPPSQMTRRKAAMIGTLFFALVDVDLPVDNSPFWGKFFNMKVLVSTANPLPTGFLSKSKDDYATWVSFRYVNLVDYCYYCARMGHVEKECPFLSKDKRKGTVRTVPIPGIYELRASKSSVKFLTVRGGRQQDSSKPGRKTPGKKARDLHQHPKHVEDMDSVGPRNDDGGPVGGESFSNLGIGKEQCQEHAGLACCSKLPTQGTSGIQLTQPTPTPQTTPAAQPVGSSKKRQAQPPDNFAKKLKPNSRGPLYEASTMNPNQNPFVDPGSCHSLEQRTTQIPLQNLVNSGHEVLLGSDPLPNSNNLINLSFVGGSRHAVSSPRQNEDGEVPTPSPSNRLSLKKQARLRAGASPASLPPTERGTEQEPNPESMAVVAGQQPQAACLDYECCKFCKRAIWARSSGSSFGLKSKLKWFVFPALVPDPSPMRDTCRSPCLHPVLSEPLETHIVLRLFLKHGHSVSVSELGGDSLLIHFPSSITMTHFIDSNHEWSVNVFDLLRPWQKSDGLSNRKVWVRAKGVPLHAWSCGFFHSIVSRFGSLISTAPMTENKTRIDYAFLQVIIIVFKPISWEISALIDETSYQITIEEVTKPPMIHTPFTPSPSPHNSPNPCHPSPLKPFFFNPQPSLGYTAAPHGGSAPNSGQLNSDPFNLMPIIDAVEQPQSCQACLKNLASPSRSAVASCSKNSSCRPSSLKMSTGPTPPNAFPNNIP
ncbi:hypothetical protein Tsubulata_004358 [Turnera subulata]|uniref:CCHC-type domain-containing protein n=1 Tax=Turnera subulata TaxID=218843 RepID=A0A9Q0G9T4_9ROSI|nr:hypothetical protein Tsubulata_004358 [Turnera subulata]